MALTTSVKSAIRVIEVLELFEHKREPCSLKEIIEHLQYPQSSTTILLKNLVSIGYLNYDRQRRKYFPTLRLARLGSWVPAALFGNGRVFDVMNDLNKITGDFIGLGIQNDVYVQYIKNIQSTYPVHFVVPEGSMRLMTNSAAGLMLLAALDDRRADYTIRRANIAVDRPEDRVKVDDIMARLPRIREQGFSYTENVPILGAATVCVLLPVKVHGQPIVMSIGGLVDRIRPRKNELVRLLKRSAASLAEDGDLAESGAVASGAAPLDTPRQLADAVPADQAGGAPATEPQDHVMRSWFEALGQYSTRQETRRTGH
jgi:DNA-binding IclR family transcriptional regulator